MIYKVRFYKNSVTGKEDVLDYLIGLDEKNKAKILKYIDFLAENRGYLDEPYSKHVEGKIRELRVDFARNHHRILYFTFINKTIILLHAFSKRTAKLPVRELEKARKNYDDTINNPQIYE